MSPNMFSSLKQNGKRLNDMVFIDGRIGNEDCDLLQSLINKSCVFVIDDFEETKKGILNVLKLRERFRNYILLEPPVLKETGRSGNLC